MKLPTIKPMYLVFLLMISFLSCNKEELPINPLSESIDDEIDTNLPCDFILNNLAPNSIAYINCSMDLEGTSITLPNNVTLVNQGGEIINGEISFSDGDVIDGDLLNSTLQISGTNPQIKDPVFIFDPKRWGIVEGVVSDAVALNNTNILNRTLKKAKEMGVTTFKLAKMDAYFNIEGNDNSNHYVNSSKGSIQMLSGLDFIMDSETVLRKQPSDFKYNYFISFYDVDNVTLSGGTIIGDKYKVGKPISEHNMNIAIIGSHNINILGVTTKEAMGDGIYITHKWLRNPKDGSITNDNRTSEKVLIKDCIIDNNARQGISPVDCNGLVVDSNIISNTGKDVGTLPRCGMDLEAWRTVNSDGSVNEYQRVENVNIINNTFFGNTNTDIVLYTCNDVLIDGNTFSRGIANKRAVNVEISNNTMNGNNEYANAIVVSSLLGSVDRVEKNLNWNIHDNNISGYSNGIIVSGENYKIYNNSIKECKHGITIGSRLSKANFYNNKIESNVENSYGYSSLGGNPKNIVIKNEDIKVTRSAIDFYKLNGDSNSLIFDSCNLISTKSSSIRYSKNIKIINSTLTRDLSVIESENVLLNGKLVSGK